MRTCSQWTTMINAFHLVHNNTSDPGQHEICNFFSIRLPNLKLEVFVLPWMKKSLAVSIEVFTIPWFFVNEFCFLYCLEYIIMIGELSWLLSFVFVFVGATQLPSTPYDNTWERVCPSKKTETFSMPCIQRCNSKQRRREKMRDAIKFHISEKRSFKHSIVKMRFQKTCRVSLSQLYYITWVVVIIIWPPLRLASDSYSFI